jgi:hypothetical protein
MPGQHQFVLTFADDAAESSAGAVFSGNAPRAFIPGKRHFERLAQSWADKCGALFVDSTGFSQERLTDAVARWLRGQGTFELQSAMAMGRNEGFHGTLTWRASVAVEHDRLEKLVEVPVTLGPKLPPEEFESQVTCSKGELDLASLPAPERDAVAEAINRDPDLYKFVDFYGKRLAEELPNARTSALEQRVRQQFTHSFAAQTVSARGVKFAVVQVAARIGIDGHGPYETVLEFKPWRNDDCAVQPLEEWIPCAATGIAVPRSATDECSVTGQRALRHRLARSEESGRAGLPDRVVRCEATGAQILPDEAERCSVTGRLIRQSLMETSVISGTKAARSALVKCEFTNDWLLPSEAGTSDISGKKFRLDQAMRSAVSQRHGHASEFVASVSPTGWIARDEAARSSVSGEWAAAEAMRPSDRPPHRLGLPHEFVQCSVSGRSLLRDEAVISAVSGRVIDRELAVASASSGKFALPEEMVSCERSGRRLLPDEAVRCTVTGTLVDARDTAASGVSGKPALKELLLRCPETGKLMLPDEAVICAASGTRVLPATLGFCAVTQRRAVKRRMAACPSTGLSFIDDSISRNAVLASTGEFNVLQRCAWTGETVLGTQLRPCVISGIRVVPGQLNKDGELIALREMLDGAAPRGMRTMHPSEIAATMNALQERRSWHSGVILEGPGRAISVSAIRMKMGLFGLGSSFLAVALERGIPPRIAGRPTEGRRVGGIWKRDSAP